MKSLEKEIVKFSTDRDWLKYNTPENLAKSISIESGELLECFQWGSEFNYQDTIEELADVMNYCILMCHQIGADPKTIIKEKIKKNEKKYPIDKCKGKSTKYTKL